MTPRALLGLLCLGGCGLDARSVEVRGACFEPLPDGTIANFSDASARRCPAGYCAPELIGSPSVSLGETGLDGLVFPYASPYVLPVGLGVSDTPGAGDAPPGKQLWVTLDTVSSSPYALSAADGFALRFAECVDAAGYSKVSFTTTVIDSGTLPCPLRFGVQFMSLDEGAPDTVLRLDALEAPLAPVLGGTTTLTFARNGDTERSTALAGMQWEFLVPGQYAVGCGVYLTIDDIRLSR